MRKYLLVALLLLVNCSIFAIDNQSSNRKSSNRQSVVFSVDLHCQGCCDKIMKNIAFEKGVKDIVCDLKTKTVTVTFDANKTDIPALLEAFKKINKPATVKTEEPSPKQEVDAETSATQLQ